MGVGEVEVVEVEEKGEERRRDWGEERKRWQCLKFFVDFMRESEINGGDMYMK